MLFFAALVLFSLALVYNLHLPPWTSFHNEVLAFGGLLCLAFQKRVGDGQNTGYAKALMGLAGLIGFQALAYPEPYLGDLATLGLYGLGAIVAFQWGRQSAPLLKQPHIEMAAAAFLVTCWLTAMVCWAQYLRVDYRWPTLVLPLENAPRVFGNLGQPNHTATLAATGWLVLTALFANGRCRTLPWALGTIPLLGAVILTQSRSGALSVLLACSVGAWWSRSQLAGSGPTPLRRLHWLSCALLFLISAVLFHLYEAHSIGYERIASKGSRPIIWLQILNGLRESPWLGYGWMRVPEAQERGAAYQAGLEVVDFSHNFVLDQLVWWGIPLALLVLSIGGLWFIHLWRRSGSGRGWLPFVLLPLTLHSLLEMPYAYAYFLWPALILAGAWKSRIDPPLNTRHPFSLGAEWIGKTSFLAIGCAICWAYIQIEDTFRERRFVLQGFPHQVSNVVAHDDRSILTHMEDALWAIQLDVRAPLDRSEMERLARTTRRFNWQAVHFRWLLALVYAERHEEAKAHLLQIRALFGRSMYTAAISALKERAATDRSPETFLRTLPAHMAPVQPQHKDRFNVILPVLPTPGAPNPEGLH